MQLISSEMKIKKGTKFSLNSTCTIYWCFTLRRQHKIPWRYWWQTFMPAPPMSRWTLHQKLSRFFLSVHPPSFSSFPFWSHSYLANLLWRKVFADFDLEFALTKFWHHCYLDSLCTENIAIFAYARFQVSQVKKTSETFPCAIKFPFTVNGIALRWKVLQKCSKRLFSSFFCSFLLFLFVILHEYYFLREISCGHNMSVSLIRRVALSQLKRAV